MSLRPPLLNEAGLAVALGSYFKEQTARSGLLIDFVSTVEGLAIRPDTALALFRIAQEALNNIVNGKAGISPEMALRLSKAFGSTPETWLRLQMNHDLAQVGGREGDIRVKRYSLERVS